MEQPVHGDKIEGFVFEALVHPLDCCTENSFPRVRLVPADQKFRRIDQRGRTAWKMVQNPLSEDSIATSNVEVPERAVAEAFLDQREQIVEHLRRRKLQIIASDLLVVHLSGFSSHSSFYS
jgi:hypothetical protein